MSRRTFVRCDFCGHEMLLNTGIDFVDAWWSCKNYSHSQFFGDLSTILDCCPRCRPKELEPKNPFEKEKI